MTLLKYITDDKFHPSISVKGDMNALHTSRHESMGLNDTLQTTIHHYCIFLQICNV